VNLIPHCSLVGVNATKYNKSRTDTAGDARPREDAFCTPPSSTKGNSWHFSVGKQGLKSASAHALRRHRASKPPERLQLEQGRARQCGNTWDHDPEPWHEDMA